MHLSFSEILIKMQFTAFTMLLASGLASAGTAAIPVGFTKKKKKKKNLTRIHLQADSQQDPNCNIFSDIPATAVGVRNIVNFLQSIPGTSAYADPSSVRYARSISITHRLY